VHWCRKPPLKMQEPHPCKGRKSAAPNFQNHLEARTAPAVIPASDAARSAKFDKLQITAIFNMLLADPAPPLGRRVAMGTIRARVFKQ
jgi:hypothetical protein